MSENRLFTVTGGCGFIGAHLARALIRRGDRVQIIDDLSTGRRDAPPSEAELVVGDISDADALNRAISGADGVFHLAAIASVERCNIAWRDSHRTNLFGTVSVFEAARDAGPKPLPVAFASSAAIYGAATTMPIAEEAPKNPMSPYGADKLSAELHAAVAADLFGLPSTACRFFNVFGPGQDPSSPYSGVISIFADRLSRGADITIYGDGGQSRDFIYVADVVAGLIAAMERMLDAQTAGKRARFDPVNFCTGRAVTVEELAGTLRDLTGSGGKITFGPARDGDIRDSLGSPAQMHRILGLKAETSLEQGLRELLATGRSAQEAAE